MEFINKSFIGKIKNKIKYNSFSPSNENVIVIQNYHFLKSKKIFFIHIPKSAGISIHSALFGFDSLGHVRYTDYKQFLSSNIFKKFRFVSFVRDPYARLLSSFFYLKNGGRGHDIDIEYQSLLKKYDSFNDFVDKFLNHENILKIDHFVPQSLWLSNEEGKVEIDFIGKFENLNEDYNKLQLKYNISSTKLTHQNKTSHKTKTFFSQKNLEKINVLYKIDFENFGYELIKNEFYI